METSNLFFAIDGDGTAYKDKLDPSTIFGVAASSRINELLKAVFKNKSPKVCAVGPATNAKFSILDFTTQAANRSIGPISSDDRDDSVSEFLLNLTPKSDFSKGNGIEIRFIDAVSENDVNTLINQLDISKFRGKSKQSITDASSTFLKELADALSAFPQMQIANALPNIIASQEQTIQQLDADIKAANANIAKINAQPITDAAKQQQIAAIEQDIGSKYSSIIINNSITDTLDNQKQQLAVRKDFASLSKALFDKVNMNYDKFKVRFVLVVNTLYDALNPNETKDQARQKNSDAIKQDTTTEDKAGLAVDKLQQQQEKLQAEAEANNQIIQVQATPGVNTFNHQPFENALSILDILRTEEDINTFETVTNVSQAQQQALPTGEDQSVCNDILKKFSVTDIQNMIKSLNDQKSINATILAKNLVDINRMQKSGGFQFMSAFSGVTGINFGKVDFDAFNIDFGQIKTDLLNGVKAVKSLSISDLGSPFGQLVNQATGIVNTAKSDLMALAKTNMNSVNFSKVFSGIDASTISKCPALSEIKNIMQNPGSVATSSISKAKSEAQNVTKSVSEKVDVSQSLLEQNKNIDNRISQLTTLVNAGGLAK